GPTVRTAARAVQLVVAAWVRAAPRREPRRGGRVHHRARAARSLVRPPRPGRHRTHRSLGRSTRPRRHRPFALGGGIPSRPARTALMTITTDRFTGKVALVSGAGRGQGRQVAIDLAKEGADIIGFDICQDISTASVPMATTEDLDKTRVEVEATGRSMIAMAADVRDYAQVEAVVQRGLAEFGRLDVVVANAGIVVDTGPFWELSLQGWNDIIATNLTGVFHTAKAATPAIIEGGRGAAPGPASPP